MIHNQPVLKGYVIYQRDGKEKNGTFPFVITTMKEVIRIIRLFDRLDPRSNHSYNSLGSTLTYPTVPIINTKGK